MSGFFEPSSIPREAMKFIEDSGFQLIFRDKLHLLSNHVTRGAKSRTSHYRHFDDLLEKMALTCKGLIGEKYMETVFINTTTAKLVVHKNFDIVILLKGTKEKDVIPSNIMGMLITEKGECRSHRNIHVLNLICTKGPTGSPIGRILMFVYVYTSWFRRLPLGLLELAGCYENIKGLCLYNKFGFREDISMKERNCFEEDDTLAMYVDLRDPQMNLENMLDALISSNDIPVLSDAPEPLCEKGSLIGPRGAYQATAISERMENFYNIIDSRDNISSLLRANKIPIGRGETVKTMIKKLAQKSKQGEAIVVPGKSGYTRRKTPSPPSRPLVPPPVRIAPPSTAPMKGPFSSLHRKTKGNKKYKKAKTVSKRAKGEFLSSIFHNDR
jgi:hypothetical protein